MFNFDKQFVSAIKTPSSRSSKRFFEKLLFKKRVNLFVFTIMILLIVKLTFVDGQKTGDQALYLSFALGSFIVAVYYDVLHKMTLMLTLDSTEEEATSACEN